MAIGLDGRESDTEAAISLAETESWASITRKPEAEIEPVAIHIADENEYMKLQFQEQDHAKRLFLYAWDQRELKEASWFPDYGILHRLNIADINNRLAICKKEIYELRSASDDQMIKLRGLLDDQATAIRNYQYIQSQEWQIQQVQDDLQEKVSHYFFDIAKSKGNKNPFDSENYRRLAQPANLREHGDPLRHFLCSHLKVWMTYSKEERETRRHDFEHNYPPIAVSPQIEKLARFLIAMFGAVSILVPMIIMSLDPSKTKSLITTSVAVVLFACCCSLSLQTANDQTLAATAGYAAVLMVFVGLTG
ncbi:hypothetical protein DSL72_003771 [Monilinia vaccinii-corymbosi]|uniref:DUF6594 domain-containing protein n=1 Tax=Monilinia vaccinii-corymbosi TaxID=61207 RepID=A0A8A3P890_9HELO|nr:hypothetical protein DSL72_003771 [Monilinia vaccinii-corymbosi]